MSEYDHHDPLQLISLLDTRDARIAELEAAKNRLRDERDRLQMALDRECRHSHGRWCECHLCALRSADAFKESGE